jgi:hypothetical protein
MINIPTKCRIAIIAHNHAMILPYHANPRRMEFSERTRPTKYTIYISHDSCAAAQFRREFIALFGAAAWADA